MIKFNLKFFLSILVIILASLKPSFAEEPTDLLKINWSFKGLTGKFDRASLQRGFQIYKEVCSSCHSMEYLSYRNLGEEGGPEFSLDLVESRVCLMVRFSSNSLSVLFLYILIVSKFLYNPLQFRTDASLTMYNICRLFRPSLPSSPPPPPPLLSSPPPHALSPPSPPTWIGPLPWPLCLAPPC